MIVDVHTHTPTHQDAVPPAERRAFSGWREGEEIATTTTWSEYADAFADIDVSIVFNIAVPDPEAETGIPTDPGRINEATADFVRNDPARRVGFMSVNPTAPGALDEVERCREDLGLRGIKLGPNYQRFDPMCQEARALYAYAEANGLPILFHQGASPIQHAPLRYAHPLVMDEIAMAHPELRIVMGHMGHPWQRDTIVTVRKHPHVYADISALLFRPWSYYEALLVATEWGAMDRLLFGSDYPISTPAQTMAALRGVNEVVRGTQLPRVPEDQIEALIHRDALAALGLGRD